ncbi:hypothetical protein [Photobacterium kishitanii]|uniref:Uncharacterized protein n=1 Tax=Photobacterium kishitanii TaxID=318456 RepID=A0A2T3KLV1_9GAMM|nr:hypothetical protein [Photobacterium kishitanii]PSV00646.1 hypothetical protein C9J27_05775 [Photobacterium kishitanii]
MHFYFNKQTFLEHKDGELLGISDLKGEHPIYIFYVKKTENNDECEVLHFDWIMSSRVRPMNACEAKDRISRYNPNWVFANELNKETKDKTTHIVCGYFDLIRDTWVEKVVTPILKLKPEDIVASMEMNVVLCTQEFYNDKELYLQNLSVVENLPSYFAFISHEDLSDHLNIKEVFDLIINWYKQEKEEVLSNTTSKGNILVPIRRIADHLKTANVPVVDSEGHSNAQNLIGCLRAHDLIEYCLVDIEKKEMIALDDCHTIDREDIKNNPENFKCASMLNHRFLNIFSD